MNTVSRQFSKLGLSGQKNPRQPGDNARVSVLLNDFADADKVLAAIIDNCRLWRDSWAQLLSAQHGTIVEYEKLYDPVVGASDGCGQHLQPTPKLQVNRTFRLREAYDELKKELSQEVTQIDTRVIQPATDVRELTTGVKKTIKKRENKRVDFEKSSDKVLKLQRKMGRSAKEDAALAKAQADMERLQEDFLAADSHLLETLPPLINAKFSLLPVLLESLILVQNTILGLYYTYLNQYCKDCGFPSPPPPMEDVIATWSTSFEPARREIEAIAMVARGKAIKSPLTVGDEPGRPQVKPQNLSSFSLRGGLRRTSTQASVNEAEEEEPPSKPPRPRSIRSAASTGSVSPNPATSSQNMLPDYSGPQGYIAPTAFTTACNLGQTPTHLTPGAPRPGYLSRASSASTTGSVLGTGGGVAGAAAAAAAAAAKKKPPPPPPPRKKPSLVQAEYVVALYSFPGQGGGDLGFREGDRIKIIEKTNTDQDWWVGELRGVKGNFPANYCRKE